MNEPSSLARRANQSLSQTQNTEPYSLEKSMENKQLRQATTGALPYLTNAINSVTRGVVDSTFELPYNIINNAPKLVNLLPGEQGVETLDEMGAKVGGPIGNLFARLGKDPIIDYMGRHSNLPNDIGSVSNPNPEYATDSRVFEDIGAGVGTLGAGAMVNTGKGLAGKFGEYLAGKGGKVAKYAAAPLNLIESGVQGTGKAILANPIASVAGETAASVGAGFGRQVADEYDIQNPVGRFALEMVGGMTPSGIIDAGQTGARKMLSREGGDVTLDAMDRIGMRPSIGLTGNQNASTLENAAAILPFFGSVSKNVQTGQIDQFGDIVKDTASKVRPAGAISRADDMMIGEQVRDISTEGLGRMKSNFGQREDALMSSIGARTPIDVTNTRKAIEAMLPTVDGEMQGALQRELQLLDDMLVQNKTTAMQPKASNILDANGQPIMTNVPVENMTATNTVPYEQFRSWRTNVGRRTDQPSIKGGQSKQLYKAITQDLEGAADTAGVGDDFRTLMSEQATARDDTLRLSEGGDIPAMEQISESQVEAGKNYFKQAIINPDRIQMLKRNATPEQWKQFAGDTLEYLGLAKNAAQDATGEAISANTFLTNWNTMDPRTRVILFDDGEGTLETLNDLAIVAEAMKGRGNASNFSNTAGVGMSAAALGAIGGGAGVAGLSSTLAALPGAAVGAGITYGTVKALMSETLARWATKQGVPLNELVGTKAVTGAAKAGVTTEDQDMRREPMRVTVRPSDRNKQVKP
jgi:hypothetical protein